MHRTAFADSKWLSFDEVLLNREYSVPCKRTAEMLRILWQMTSLRTLASLWTLMFESKLGKDVFSSPTRLTKVFISFRISASEGGWAKILLKWWMRSPNKPRLQWEQMSTTLSHNNVAFAWTARMDVPLSDVGQLFKNFSRVFSVWIFWCRKPLANVSHERWCWHKLLLPGRTSRCRVATAYPTSLPNDQRRTSYAGFVQDSLPKICPTWTPSTPQESFRLLR